MSVFDVVRQPSLVAVTGIRHGLGNRVRVVLGARSLARLESRRLFYTWNTGREFGSRFDELWEINDPVVRRSTARILERRFPFRDEKLAWITDSVRQDRVWQIRTPHALHLPDTAIPWEQELQGLRPVSTIRNRVDEFFDSQLRGDPYVGVMVRAHPRSHEATLRESPISWYLDRMNQLREKFPDIRFFVSADTIEAQRHVLESVSECVALSDKGGYNSVAGLQASVADLYLLAGSTHILAPHYSSFPQLAQKLAGSSLTLETSHTDPAESSMLELETVEDPTRPHLRRRG